MNQIESKISASGFLAENGNESIVTLGCGRWVNRIDNHLRLMMGLNLRYYVGIDYASWIKPAINNVFMAPDIMDAMLAYFYQGRSERFWKAAKFFPKTFVEELKGIHCAAVVCQRVLPGCRWEDLIISMNPKFVLQEDLHGCERQQLRGKHYVRTWSNIRHFGLKPFRPWPIFPKEKNLILWRRRDLDNEDKKRDKSNRLERIFSSFIG